MCAPAVDSSVGVAINGDVIQSGGAFTTNGTSNSGTSVTIIQNGDINVTGGNFSISRGSQGGTGKAEWHVNGDFSMTNAATQNSNPSGGKFIFTGSEVHNLTLGSGNTLTALPIEVDSGSTLNLGASELLGSGIFTLNAGAAFGSGHPEGINGNLKNTGTRTLSTEASYIFNGTAAQITGDMLPDEVQNLIMDNSEGITLSKSVTVNGIMEIRKAGFSIGNYILNYGQGAALMYSGTTALTTSDNEFPSQSGPENIIIDNSSSSGITLHANRTITGNLFLSGKFRLENNNFTAATADKEGSNDYVVTNGIGFLTLLDIGAAETLFPIGTTSYAPVWIANNGVADNISITVEPDNNTLPEGGRVRVKWTLAEGTIGGGDYTLRFGWLTQLEDLKFRQNRQANAGIFLLGSDTTEAGTGSYVTQFANLPYTVSRGGITSLGSFGVGKFGEITVDVNELKVLPSEFSLSQNYPNPFNPSTQINYSVPKNSFITLKVYNLLGELVMTLFEGFKQQGNYTAIFDANGLSSGIYIYRMMAENPESGLPAGKAGSGQIFTDTKKTILLK